MQRSNRRRARALAVLPLAGALLLAGCSANTGGGGAGGETGLADVTAEQLKGTTIQLARFFGDCEDATEGVTDVSQAVGECEVIQILTNKFNAENEFGITVERLGGAEWNTYYDTLNAAYAGGDAPDVAVIHGSRIVDYAERNLLLPLDDVVDVTDADLGDAAPAAAEAVTHEDKTYALPFDLHAALVHLNLDIFTQAGLVDAAGQPVLPTTPDEFFAAAQTVQEKTGKSFFAIPRVNDRLGIRLLQSLIQQQGGDLLSEDNTESRVDSPETRQALEFMQRMFDEGYANGGQTYDAAQQSFLNGEVAMLMNGTWVVDQYDEQATFNYKATNFPSIFGEEAIWADSHAWSIPRQKDADPAAYRAALEFISYLYENEAAWAVGTGHLAARSSVLQSAEYANAPQRANYAETGLESARLVPHIGNWPAVDDILTEQVEAIWFQDADVDEALAEADDRINAALAK